MKQILLKFSFKVFAFILHFSFCYEFKMNLCVSRLIFRSEYYCNNICLYLKQPGGYTQTLHSIHWISSLHPLQYLYWHVSIGIPSFSNHRPFETHTAHLARGHDLTDSGYGLLSRPHECQAFLQERERPNEGERERIWSNLCHIAGNYLHP